MQSNDICSFAAVSKSDEVNSYFRLMTHLYLIPTPIGNLEDVTLRALTILKEVDVILCEDTRTSSKFLTKYSISKPLESFHQHNEHVKSEVLIRRMKAGEVFALITDAGTPGISDPGYLLARKCIDEGIEIQTLPGATAIIPALVNSGLPSERFCFEGFLPHKKGRHTKLTQLAEEERTMIFYESPHRILKTLKQMTEYFGEERKASLSRELTKIHEETVRGTIRDIIEYYEQHTLKGEIVLVVAGTDLKKRKNERD